jgi:hypothetical protein
MACFTMAWFFQLLIWLIVVGACLALVRLLLPWALSFFGVGAGILTQAINIIIGAVVAIIVVYLIWMLASCAFSGGGLHLLPPKP